jgi:predicted RNase H-like HicB family nuclease
MKHYTAQATRSGKWWALTVDGLKGAHSQVKRLDQAEESVREVISLMTGDRPDSFTVDVLERLSPDLEKNLRSYIEVLNAFSELERRLSEAQAATVQELIGNGLTMRDVGSLMGLSYQRVGQIASGSPTDQKARHTRQQSAGRRRRVAEKASRRKVA